MKNKETKNEQEKEMNKSSFFQKLGNLAKKVKSSPILVIGSLLCIAGAGSIIFANAKIASANRENKGLREENIKLGKQLNEAWYQLGKASANK